MSTTSFLFPASSLHLSGYLLLILFLALAWTLDWTLEPATCCPYIRAIVRGREGGGLNFSICFLFAWDYLLSCCCQLCVLSNDPWSLTSDGSRSLDLKLRLMTYAAGRRSAFGEIINYRQVVLDSLGDPAVECPDYQLPNCCHNSHREPFYLC